MTIAVLITDGLGSFARPASMIKGGFSSRVQLPEPPPSGYFQRVMSSLIAETPLPAALVSGDIVQHKLLSLEGYPVTIPADGDVTVDSGGDESRQRILYNFWDASALEMYFTSDSTLALNDQAPTVPTSSIPHLYIQPNQSYAPINVITMAGASDFEGDAFTVAALDGGSTFTRFPSGGTLEPDGDVTGIFDTSGVFIYALRFTDEYGAFTDSTQTAIIGNRVLPDVIGQDGTTGLSILNANYFENATFIGIGNIVAQIPQAGSTVDPTQLVQLIGASITRVRNQTTTLRRLSKVLR